MDHKGSCTNYVIADRIMITVLAELGGKSPPPIAEFFWQETSDQLSLEGALKFMYVLFLHSVTLV